MLLVTACVHILEWLMLLLEAKLSDCQSKNGLTADFMDASQKLDLALEVTFIQNSVL